MILQIIIATIVGVLIGAEREISSKPAGLRTITLIVTSCCILAIAFTQIFPPDAVSRVVANMLTGIGFIGGGVIVHAKGSVYGITTAATIWAGSIIGILFGLNMLLLGGILAAITLISLRLFGAIEKRLNRHV